jgi:WXG100 family type VII secretion target
LATKATATEINNAANAADEAAQSIRKQVNNTVDSMQSQALSFTGAAGTAFRNKLAEFAQDMDKYVLQKLEELAGGTRTAATKLFGTDEAAASSINKAGAGASPSGVTAGLS